MDVDIPFQILFPYKVIIRMALIDITINWYILAEMKFDERIIKKTSADIIFLSI